MYPSYWKKIKKGGSHLVKSVSVVRTILVHGGECEQRDAMQQRYEEPCLVN